MGLDMFLNEATSGNEVCYWRKSNQIHKWFVDNVQDGKDDGGSYPVTNEQLIELRNLCEQVLDNRDLAEKLLPVQSGFFFGSMEYDDWYFDGLRSTINQIDNALETCCDDKLEYYASW